MAYEEYTTCVPASQHSKVNQYVQAAFAAVLSGGILSLLIVLLPSLIPLMPTWLAGLLSAAGDPVCYVIAALIGGLFGVIAYCDWWLYDRLICLGGGGAASDRFAVGMLVSVEPPWSKSGLDKFDTDYSINLLLAPNPPGADQATVGASQPFGHLIAEQPETKQEGLPFKGDNATDKQTGVTSAILHCEFEGKGIVVVKDWAEVALGVMIVALLICLTPWGKVLAIFLMLLALLGLSAGIGLAPTQTTSPTLADPTLGELHTNDKNGYGADILAVLGRWVYDAGHNDKDDGWNELHPLKACVRIGRWRGKWWQPIDALVAEAEEHLRNAIAPATLAAQQAPEHQWQVHPYLDGCAPARPPAVVA